MLVHFDLRILSFWQSSHNAYSDSNYVVEEMDVMHPYTFIILYIPGQFCAPVKNVHNVLCTILFTNTMLSDVLPLPSESPSKFSVSLSCLPTPPKQMRKGPPKGKTLRWRYLAETQMHRAQFLPRHHPAR